MSPRQPPFKRARRLRRWLIPAALFALAPKCVLCLLAYSGLAAALGVAGPELCGAPAGVAAESWALSPALTAVAFGVLGLYASVAGGGSIRAAKTFFDALGFHPQGASPSSRAGFRRATRSISSSVTPAVFSAAMNVRKPSVCTGVFACPRSEEIRKCSAPTA
jgi:hypothetical protein